jgi:site-specific recombinase XerD
MLRLYRRHSRKCPQKSERYRRCGCPIYVEGTLANEYVRKALDLSSWEAATDVIRSWEKAGRIGGAIIAAPPLINEAVKAFLDDAEARGLKTSSLKKYSLALKNHLMEPANRAGCFELRDLTVNAMRSIRNNWKVSARTQQKTIEMLRSFFRFCETAEWIARNPMQGIKPPKVTDVPTLPVDDGDFAKLINGAAKLGVTGHRLRTLFLVLRYSGLRISDGISLTADRLKGDRLFLRQQKTGVFVHLPLPDFVASALRKEFAEHDRPFWRGRGAISSVIENWRRAAYTVAGHTGVRNFHFHRLRDSFAVSLLERGVDIETVAVLLGHSSSAVTRKHYNPWVESRQVALESAVRRTWTSVA